MRGRTWKGTGKKWRTMASRRLADRRHGPSRPGRGAGGGDNHTGLRRTSECGGKLCAVRAPKRMASGRRDAPGLRRRAGRAQPTPEARQGKGGGGGGLGGCRCPEVATDPAPLAVSWPGVRLGPVGAGGGRPGGQARGVWTGRVAAPIHLPLPRENGQSGLLRGSRSRSGRSVQAEGDPPEALDGC